MELTSRFAHIAYAPALKVGDVIKSEQGGIYAAT